MEQFRKVYSKYERFLPNKYNNNNFLIRADDEQGRLFFYRERNEKLKRKNILATNFPRVMSPNDIPFLVSPFSIERAEPSS